LIGNLQLFQLAKNLLNFKVDGEDVIGFTGAEMGFLY